MLNDRENILTALREKALKVREIMKRANVVNEEACQSLLLKMRDEVKTKLGNYLATISSAGQRDADQLIEYGVAYLRGLHEGPDSGYTGC